MSGSPSRWQKFWSRHVENHPNFWTRLGRFESEILDHKINQIEVKSPIFITGLARSGSTILLEILNQHYQTTSLQNQDFPFIDIPWLHSKFLRHQKNIQPVERTHKDRILVTPESPEALDESLWMRFFQLIHDVNACHVLDESSVDCGFGVYYQNIIKRLLLVRGGNRYLCKGNYLVTRIHYLLSIFPDAKFVIPIRDPVTHIASLLKQHKLFSLLERETPAILTHMQRVGHFEFGLDRRSVNTGNVCDSEEINQLFLDGKDIQGYAKQWSVIYRYVNTLLEDEKIRDHIKIVYYENLCQYSYSHLEALFSFLGLEVQTSVLQNYANQLSAPEYYQYNFSKDDMGKIQSMSADVAQLFGYCF